MFELESEAGPSLSRDSVEVPERTDSAGPAHEATASPAADTDEIELSRRAVPVVQPEADNVCSICLDEFTADDPGQQTQCRCVAPSGTGSGPEAVKRRVLSPLSVSMPDLQLSSFGSPLPSAVRLSPWQDPLSASPHSCCVCIV